MTGFIKGLFGGKKKTESEEAPAPTPAQIAKAQKVDNAYFLTFDDAQTMGNLEYMRTSKKVRRTFPKTAEGQEKELVQEVSATVKQAEAKGTSLSNVGITIKPVEGNGASAVSKPDAAAERRRTDTSMDMFRNMARDIRK